MYIARGGNPTEIGDMDVIVHEGRIHMFVLNVSGHDVVNHLVSDDAMHWEELPNALYTGHPGDFDDDQIWTMHTFRWEDRFYMLYTALAKETDGRHQTTGLAVSDDLITWEKVPHNPVAAPDARWYEADLSDSGRADWRDPFAWVEDGVIHALVVAHENRGPYNRRGCVAHLTSTDALHWEVREPFYTPRVSGDWEVPCLFKMAGRYYLVGHICAPQIDVYRIADSLDGPWRRPLDDVILPAPNHIFVPFEWRGKTLFTNWISVAEDWENAAFGTRIIAPPKEVHARDDGTLFLKPSADAWDAAAVEAWQEIAPADAGPDAAPAGTWTVADGAVVGTSHPGMGSLLVRDDASDFEFEATLQSDDAPQFGLVWRSDGTVDAYTRVSLVPGRQQVELAKITVPRRRGIIGRGWESIQSNTVPMTPGQSVRVRVAAYGPYVEVSLDGVVFLAACTMTRRSGGLGFFVEDGTVRVTDVRTRRLEAPRMKLPYGPIPRT